MRQLLYVILFCLTGLQTLKSQEIPTDWPSHCNSEMSLSISVFLDAVDEVTCLMPIMDTLPNFPLIDPYWFDPFRMDFSHHNTYLEVNSTMIKNTLSNFNVVDWVFVELRKDIPFSETNNVLCVPDRIFSKVGFLLDNGSIIDLDGNASLRFNCTFRDSISPGYYVSVRHRNHLSISTENPIDLLDHSINVVDFTLLNGIPVHQEGEIMHIACNGTRRKMTGGDADKNGSVDAFDTIIWENENGAFDDYFLNSDYDLSGSVDAFDSIIWENRNGLFSEYFDCPNGAQNRSKNHSDIQLATGTTSISPNPAKDRAVLRYNSPNEQNVMMQLYDFQGKIIRSLSLSAIQGENSFPIDLAGLEAGIYGLKVQNTQSIKTYKLVKQQ